MEFLECSYIKENISLVGVDEVGRGPLAGPVVSCACSFKGRGDALKETFEFFYDLGVTDSKKISPQKRKKIISSLGLDESLLVFNKALSFKVLGHRFNFTLCEVGPSEIDDINILEASLRSMYLCLQGLKVVEEDCDIWLDGNKIPRELKGRGQVEAIVKGDSKSLLIALASIIAKEKRDLLMEEFAQIYPHYGFEKHAGYPTKFHKEAIESHGVSPIHRRTFKGVREFL